MASWFSWGSQGSVIKTIESALSSVSAPVISAIKSGFDSARANPNVAILSTLLVTSAGYLLLRRYGKAKEVSNLDDIRNSLRGINRRLDGHADTLNNHTTSLASLARTLLTLTEPLMNCRTSGINIERTQAEHYSGLLSQFRDQNITLSSIDRSLGTVKRDLDVVVTDVRARSRTL